jgi:hypothetical protein
VTKLLEQAVETVRGLPPDVQDELARILLQLAGKDQTIVESSMADDVSFAESFAQADRGEFAADKIRPVKRRYTRRAAREGAEEVKHGFSSLRSLHATAGG